MTRSLFKKEKLSTSTFSNKKQTKNIFSTGLLIAGSLLFSACSSLQGNQQPEFSVNIAEPERVRFSGKGAGAGMMLMSSMGSMGIAIGVAIDEGIAKEINEAAVAENIDVRALVKTAFSQTQGAKNIQSVNVERYGFVTRSGDGDPAVAELKMDVVCKDESTSSIAYPVDKNDEMLPAEKLENLKSDGKATIALLQASLGYAVSKNGTVCL